jgi:uncharacterized protein (DUF433 family)
MEVLKPGDPWYEVVWVDPERLGGAPAFRNTRVHVQTLFDYLKAGDSLDTFLDDFEGVTREQAEKVIELAAKAALHDLRAA